MDTSSSSAPDSCIVCGKDTTGSRGYMHVVVGERTVSLCCPQCYKVFQENPERYRARQSAQDIEREIGWDDKW